MGWIGKTLGWLAQKRRERKERWHGKTYVIAPEFLEERWGWRKRRIFWDDVTEIMASNEDMWAYTSIWLLIYDHKNTVISIEEICPDFKALNDLLGEKYEGYPKGLRWKGELEIGGQGYHQVLWSKPKGDTSSPVAP